MDADFVRVFWFQFFSLHGAASEFIGLEMPYLQSVGDGSALERKMVGEFENALVCLDEIISRLRGQGAARLPGP
jgi:hypothetical protein